MRVTRTERARLAASAKQPPAPLPSLTPEQKLDIQRSYLVKYEADARKAMTEYLLLIKRRAESMMADIDRRVASLQDPRSDDGITTPQERFSWAVNEIENFTRNCDFSSHAMPAAFRYAEAKHALDAFNAAHPKTSND